jgi:hypothetical protein
MEAKHKARKFIPNSKLMYNLTKCVGWVRTENSEERMRVAIDSLAEHILKEFDDAYEPEEKDYAILASGKVKAKSKEEAKQKFKSDISSVTWNDANVQEVNNA